MRFLLIYFYGMLLDCKDFDIIPFLYMFIVEKQILEPKVKISPSK